MLKSYYKKCQKNATKSVSLSLAPLLTILNRNALQCAWIDIWILGTLCLGYMVSVYRENQAGCPSTMQCVIGDHFKVIEGNLITSRIDHLPFHYVTNTSVIINSFCYITLHALC